MLLNSRGQPGRWTDLFHGFDWPTGVVAAAAGAAVAAATEAGVTPGIAVGVAVGVVAGVAPDAAHGLTGVTLAAGVWAGLPSEDASAALAAAGTSVSGSVAAWEEPGLLPSAGAAVAFDASADLSASGLEPSGLALSADFAASSFDASLDGGTV